MGSQRHDRITELFLQACALDSAAREAFLDEACAGNAELRAEVDSLLAHDGSRLLETGAGASRAAEVIGDAFASINESISDKVCATCGASSRSRSPSRAEASPPRSTRC